ncbi:CoA-binding domain-containing protein [Maribacter orientalis]|uniref:CoA-binding domain-containing protein n=1 Tax=Maribacter orientalis TaxID=228957 RepID=A0A1H7SIN2_9FLAO|nr:polysaccharide biosynthesis protein [Maribacter orientalis]SEL72365.1 CoA-binding domain-containing protein [Maribacter orientalis]
MIQKYLAYNTEKYASKWLVLGIDLVTIACAFVLSYLIRFNLTLDFEVENLLLQLPLVLITSLVAFLIVGSYKGVVRHTGVRDVYNIFNAVCFSSILVIFIVLANRQLEILNQFTIPLSIIIINSLITFVALTASRFVFKSVYSNMHSSIKSYKNVLIYGAGDSGVLTHGAITNHAKSRYRVLGYIDRDVKKIGKNINGVPVFGRKSLTESFILKNNISEIIFSIQNIDSRKLRKTVEGLVDYPIVVKIVPPIEDWINGELKVSQIKQVQIEDLSDIRDKNRMNALFGEHRPNIVFHAAAYKHVPLMEYNSYEAIKINIGGTKNVADLSVLHGVEKFVFVSTDKAVNPTNVMGATKRIAELYISCMQNENKTKFITTRFGNVLGSNGSVIPLFRKQIEKGGPLTLTHKDITRYFMTIPEASQLVLEAGAMGEGGEIFIFDMGESVKIYDLAKNMIKLSGLRYPEDIDIKITGLRPGEKLYEELLANGENTLPTYHQKIKISKVRDVEYSKVRSKIDELCITNMFFSGNTVKLMKEIVPEYVSKNSDFCELDKPSVDSNDQNMTKLKIVQP